MELDLSKNVCVCAYCICLFLLWSWGVAGVWNRERFVYHELLMIRTCSLTILISSCMNVSVIRLTMSRQVSVY